MSRDGKFRSNAASTALAAKLHRRDLLRAALASGVMTVGLGGPIVRGQAKKFAGVTIQGAAFQHAFHVALKEWLPELEEKTGLKVNLELQSNPIYNQRMDLELSTRGSAYDFCNIGTPWCGRWISSGWMTPLDEFVNDRNQTAPEWDAADFAGGAQAILSDSNGRPYGFAWVAGAILLGVARSDILEKAGVKIPTTADELVEACKRTNDPANSFAFVNDMLHHWEWPPYLMAQGGTIFRNPPGDLMPMLNTPEAAKAAQIYADLLAKYSPPGGISFNDDQAMRFQLSGRANMRTCSIDWLMPLAKLPDSKVKSTMRFGPMPGGPAGSFPAVNANGFGIPVGAKQKEAAWAFMQWALSKQSFLRMAMEKNQIAIPRRSVIANEQYRSAMTVNGQDIGKLYLDTVESSGPRGYMKYRVMPVFPQVGEKINKAIEQIASGQLEAKAAMELAQQAAVADIAKAGYKL